MTDNNPTAGKFYTALVPAFASFHTAKPCVSRKAFSQHLLFFFFSASDWLIGHSKIVGEGRELLIKLVNGHVQSQMFDKQKAECNILCLNE